jgi:glycerol dehydrogenase
VRNGNPVLLGSGRYIQGPGEINNIGREALFFGNRALIVADEIPWEITKTRVASSLKASGVAYRVFNFSGYCSETSTRTIATIAKEFDAQLVVGIGGGRCMDAAKWGAQAAGVRCITIPTSAATCAAYVSLCVIYDDAGSVEGVVFTDQEVGGTVVDTAIIASECPPRYLASGIADALAKEPELFFSSLHAQNWERSVLPSIGSVISEFNTENYFKKGLKALEDVAQQTVTDDLEDVVCLNIMLTGLISCFASGGKQLAIAHSMYDCITRYFKPQRAKYLHGEIVSCGLAVQAGVNGYSEDTISNLLDYLRKLGTPTCLQDIEIEPTEENVNILLDYVFTNMSIDDKGIRENIRKNIERIR